MLRRTLLTLAMPLALTGAIQAQPGGGPKGRGPEGGELRTEIRELQSQIRALSDKLERMEKRKGPEAGRPAPGGPGAGGLGGSGFGPRKKDDGGDRKDAGPGKGFEGPKGPAFGGPKGPGFAGPKGPPWARGEGVPWEQMRKQFEKMRAEGKGPPFGPGFGSGFAPKKMQPPADGPRDSASSSERRPVRTAESGRPGPDRPGSGMRRDFSAGRFGPGGPPPVAEVLRKLDRVIEELEGLRRDLRSSRR